MLDSCWRLFGEVESEEPLIGLLQFSQMGRVGLKFRQLVSQVERDHSFKTPSCGNTILAGGIDRGKESEHCGFGWFVAELDVMFRGIVETALGSSQVALVEKAFAELTIGHRESFFIPDDSVMIEGLLERGDCLLPLSLTSRLQRQIIVENTERAIVL